MRDLPLPSPGGIGSAVEDGAGQEELPSQFALVGAGTDPQREPGPLGGEGLHDEIGLGRVHTVLNSPDYREDVMAAIGTEDGPDFDPVRADLDTAGTVAAQLPLEIGPTSYRIVVPQDRTYSDEFYREVSQYSLSRISAVHARQGK